MQTSIKTEKLLHPEKNKFIYTHQFPCCTQYNTEQLIIIAELLATGGKESAAESSHGKDIALYAKSSSLLHIDTFTHISNYVVLQHVEFGKASIVWIEK